jgi:hypothetical protein
MKITLIIIIVLICVIVILIRNSQIQGELHEGELEAAKKSVGKNKKDQFKRAGKKQSPDFGDAFDDYDAQLIKNAESLRKTLKRAKVDTSKMDYWLNELKKQK